jgi:hypothetical protein
MMRQGPSVDGGSSDTKKQQAQRRTSISKFFGFVLGNGDTQEDDDVAHITTEDSNTPKMIKAKDHPDYSKYFRMATVGGNIVDIRTQMRQAGLDDNLIQTPEKMISAESKLNVRDHLKQATLVGYLDRVGEFDFHDDESDGMSSRASSVAQTAANQQQRQAPLAQEEHVHDKDFTNMFRKKPVAAAAPEPVAPTTATKAKRVKKEKKPKAKKEKKPPGNVIVNIYKPLGITMGENEEDEEQGVHVASIAPGGNAAKTNALHPGMVLLEACGEDVRFKDFDDIMDILRGAPADETLKLVFAPPEAEAAGGTNSASASASASESQSESEVESDASSVVEPSVPISQGGRGAVASLFSETAQQLLSRDTDSEEDEDDEPMQVSSSRPFGGNPAPPQRRPEEEQPQAPQKQPPPPTRPQTTAAPVTQTAPVTAPVQEKSPAASPTPQRKSLAALKSAAAAAAKSGAATKTPHVAVESAAPTIASSSVAKTGGELSSKPLVTHEFDDDDEEDDNEEDDESSGDNWGAKVPATVPALRDVTDFGMAAAIPAGGIFGLPDHLEADDSIPPPAAAASLPTERSAPAPTAAGSNAKSQSNPIAHRKTSPVPSRAVHHHGADDKEWRQEEAVQQITSPISSPTASQGTKENEHDSPGLESSLITSRPRGPRSTALLRKGRGAAAEEAKAKRATRGGLARVAPPQDMLPSPSPAAVTSAPAHSPEPAATAVAGGVFGMGAQSVREDSEEDSDVPPPVPSSKPAETAAMSVTSPLSARINPAAARSSSASVSPAQSSPSSATGASSSLPRRAGGSLGDQLKALRAIKKAASSASNVSVTESSHASAGANASVEKFPPSDVSVSSQSGSVWHEEDSISHHSYGSRFQARAATATGGGGGTSVASSQSSRFTRGVQQQQQQQQQDSRSTGSPSASISNGSNRSVQQRPQQQQQQQQQQYHHQEDVRNIQTSGSGPSSPLSTHSLRSSRSAPHGQTFTGPGGASIRDYQSDSGAFSPTVTHKPLAAYESLSPGAPQLGSRGGAQRLQQSSPVSARGVDRGMQSDYSSYVDEKYINSYQMLLGEKEEIAQMRLRLQQETEEQAALLIAQEEEAMARIAKAEEESMSRLRAEEDLLRDRVQEVEDIILMERNEIDKQWEELRTVESESDRTIKLRTKELLEVMHVVRAHHDKLQHDKKKIARQRLHLDMALHDLNRFNSFGRGTGGGGGEGQSKRAHTPTSTAARRWASPHQQPSSRGGWEGGTSVGSLNSSRRVGAPHSSSPSKERAFNFGGGSRIGGR